MEIPTPPTLPHFLPTSTQEIEEEEGGNGIQSVPALPVINQEDSLHITIQTPLSMLKAKLAQFSQTPAARVLEEAIKACENLEGHVGLGVNRAQALFSRGRGYYLIDHYQGAIDDYTNALEMKDAGGQPRLTGLDRMTALEDLHTRILSAIINKSR